MYGVQPRRRARQTMIGGIAVGGDVTLTGAASLQILANEQIPDTATLRILGTSADSLLGTTGINTQPLRIVGSDFVCGIVAGTAAFPHFDRDQGGSHPC